MRLLAVLKISKVFQNGKFGLFYCFCLVETYCFAFVVVSVWFCLTCVMLPGATITFSLHTKESFATFAS